MKDPLTEAGRLARHAALAAADQRHLWHPFTQMQDWLKEDPIIIDRAEGVELIDTLGRRYLDGVSSLWCNVHGHRVPALDEAVRAQLDRVAHSTLLGLASTASIECAEELVRHVPPALTRVFYSDAGAMAVEIAIKLAYQHFQLRGDHDRKEFVSITGGYHGDTIGSVSVGGIDLFHRIFKPLLFDVHHAPQPYCYRCPLGKALPGCAMACAGEVEALFAARPGKVAALVIEPVMQGADGMIAQPPGYLKQMREICDRHGALLICDEVATGWGRTGTTFAVEQEGVVPDIMTMAKGLTGGYLPLAATLTTEEIFRSFLGSFESRRTFFHGHTYAGNPLGCAVATASMKLFRDRKIIEGLPPKIEALRRALASLQAHPHVGEIRQRGLMVGIELVRDRESRSEYEYERRIGHQVCLEARRQGVMLRPLGNVVVIMPPLAMSVPQLEQVAAAVRSGVDAVTARI
jgi:adenosylmethionine-8-amino-7-oxononanoate aminotransferase